MKSHEPCPRTETLSALTDGELDEAARIAVEAHADGCPLCAPVLAEFRQLHGQFGALKAGQPAFDAATEVERRLRALAAPGRAAARRPPVVRRPWWQAALLVPAGTGALAVGAWLGAALVPAWTPASMAQGGAVAAQMAPFSTLPAGALCPAPRACGGVR